MLIREVKPKIPLKIIKENFTISLFGKGEELRDHVWIEDVVQIVIRILFFKSTGIINVATGKVHSFKSIAKSIIKLTSSSSKIKNTKRKGPIPHNGYRSLSNFSTKKAFPGFRYHTMFDAFKKIKDLY